ncbi:tetratricopeptide repeat protein [Kordia sp.]|uniref:tetratricopeptide repeat protein n=1 Tax=Kordia sp. TaxID=1965332 RepID=UPI003B5CECD8
MKKLTVLLSLLLLSAFIAKAQESDAELTKKVKAISKGACECIAKIDSDLEDVEKNEKIKSCITAEILADQMSNSLLQQLEKVKDSLGKMTSEKDTVSIEFDPNNNTIILDENYDEIEEYLLRNCSALKQVIMTSDKKHKNSVSEKEEALKYYNEGTQHYQRGEYENAVVAYRKAVKKDRKFAFAWDNLGLSYRRLGNYKQAIKAYKKSLKLDPKGKVPLMNIPIAQSYLKKYKDAIKSYEKFIEIYPNDPEGYYGISRMYMETKEYEKSLDNVMKSFIMYKEINSPYHKDAQSIIVMLYDIMKKENMMDTFQKIAKKHNINIQE